VKPVFSTDSVHPRDRFEYWHDVACKKIIGHEAKPKNRLKFEASIECADLAGIELIVFENAPMEAAVTVRNIARARDNCLLICRQIKGTVRLEQNSRQAVLEAGRFTVIDPRRPYTADFPVQSKMLIVKIPRRLLEQRYGHTAEISMRVVERDSGIGELTSDHLALLPRHVSALDGSTAAAVGSHALDLVALSLSKLSGDDAHPRSFARKMALAKVRTVIENRLSEPALTPSDVAAGAGISLRYAQSLLAEDETSIARLIQERRLRHCERALVSPTQQRRTISEIAFAWGFADLTHFGRLFKKRYGLSPRQYRRNRLSAGSR